MFLFASFSLYMGVKDERKRQQINQWESRPMLGEGGGLIGGTGHTNFHTVIESFGVMFCYKVTLCH